MMLKSTGLTNNTASVPLPPTHVPSLQQPVKVEPMVPEVMDDDGDSPMAGDPMLSSSLTSPQNFAIIDEALNQYQWIPVFTKLPYRFLRGIHISWGLSALFCYLSWDGNSMYVAKAYKKCIEFKIQPSKQIKCLPNGEHWSGDDKFIVLNYLC